MSELKNGLMRAAYPGGLPTHTQVAEACQCLLEGLAPPVVQLNSKVGLGYRVVMTAHGGKRGRIVLAEFDA